MKHRVMIASDTPDLESEQVILMVPNTPMTAVGYLYDVNTDELFFRSDYADGPMWSKLFTQFSKYNKSTRVWKLDVICQIMGVR